eukprot:11209181-Lingulodinium_polyedra.AAC.1
MDSTTPPIFHEVFTRVSVRDFTRPMSPCPRACPHRSPGLFCIGSWDWHELVQVHETGTCFQSLWHWHAAAVLGWWPLRWEQRRAQKGVG